MKKYESFYGFETKLRIPMSLYLKLCYYTKHSRGEVSGFCKTKEHILIECGVTDK